MVQLDSGFWWMLAAIILYFLAMIAIGVWASMQTKSSDDYMIGGRDLPAPVAALSAGASDMSGWLLLGLPGALYMGGLVQAWIAIGLTLGAWANWKLVAPRLRLFTEQYGNAITLPSFFGNRLVHGGRVLRVISGLVILIFFTFYISSGMVAGGNFAVASFGGALEQSQGWSSSSVYLGGMLLIAAVTIFYTLIGGFLGASFTDFVQGTLMFLALLAVPIVALIVAQPATLVQRSNEVVPGAFDLFNLDAAGGLIGVISLFCWFFGYFGQPHILVRFMALRSHHEARSARRWGIGWMALCVLGAIGTGLLGISLVSTGRVSLSNTETGETIFLDSALGLFPAFLAGLVLAAVLAAIMSTISSQLVVTASALVEDLVLLFRRKPMSPSASLWASRAAVLVIALVAVLMAINPSDSILALVGFAWAGFGAAFGPTVVLSLYWRKLTAWGAIASMVLGTATVFLWKQTPWSDLYEIIPGLIVATLAAVVVSLITYRRHEGTDRHFDAAMKRVRAAKDSDDDRFDDSLPWEGRGADVRA